MDMVQVKKLEVEVDPEALQGVAGLCAVALPARYRRLVVVLLAVVLAVGLLSGTGLLLFPVTSGLTALCPIGSNVSCVL